MASTSGQHQHQHQHQWSAPVVSTSGQRHIDRLSVNQYRLSAAALLLNKPLALALKYGKVTTIATHTGDQTMNRSEYIAHASLTAQAEERARPL